MAVPLYRYRQAIDEVGGLTEADLVEVRSYNNPPERVKLVMMAVCILFDAPTDWRSAQRLLGETSPKLLERMVAFDVRSVSVMATAKLTRIVQEPEFNIVAVQQVRGWGASCCWETIFSAQHLQHCPSVCTMLCFYKLVFLQTAFMFL